jgi:glycosyltransferase involved in cell wall biosynthesis
MRAAVLVPAYGVARVIGDVVSELVRIWPEQKAVLVIDDGSEDGTAEIASRAGAVVLRHSRNRGKGETLRTGLRAALARSFDVAVSVDGDGQHPPAEALRLHQSCADAGALVIGVRDLERAGAPRPSQLSNRFSNLVLSGFSGRRLNDTQCGLRRYPVAATLALGARDTGYGYEAEVILRAVAGGLPIVEVPIEVLYPPEEERISHFHSVRDPARIVARVVSTVVSTRARRMRERLAAVTRGAQ